MDIKKDGQPSHHEIEYMKEVARKIDFSEDLIYDLLY